MKKLHVVVGAAGFVFVLVAAALQATSVWSQETTRKHDSKTAEEIASRWSTYVSDQYGFQFRFPPGCRIERQNDTNYTYIRVQNYDPSNSQRGSGSYGLEPNEFYLEIFIIDPSLGHRKWEPWEKAIKHPKRTSQGDIVVSTGIVEEPEGDPGGYRHALCARLQKCDIWVQGTEGRKETPTVKAILKTFRFSK